VSQPTPVQGWSELLLALPEFILTGAHVDVHDELVAEIELPRGLQACPRCGTIERHRVHDRRRHTVRHVPVAGRACRLVWCKRLLSCVEGCGSFAERTPSIAPGAVWSRAAARAAVAMSAENVPIDTIRKMFGVAWNTVMRAVVVAAELVAPVRPTRVGIDETVMVTGRLTTRRRQFLTSLVCLDTSLVVAVTQGRDRASATRLLAEHAPDAQVVTLDLFSGFKSAADTIEGVTIVADVFHLVRLALQALDEVRRRRQQQTCARRGHKHDPLFRLRGGELRVLVACRFCGTDQLASEPLVAGLGHRLAFAVGVPGLGRHRGRRRTVVRPRRTNREEVLGTSAPRYERTQCEWPQSSARRLTSRTPRSRHSPDQRLGPRRTARSNTPTDDGTAQPVATATQSRTPRLLMAASIAAGRGTRFTQSQWRSRRSDVTRHAKA